MAEPSPAKLSPAVGSTAKAIYNLADERTRWRATAVDHGGSGPHDPNMEARVTRLEDQFTRIEALLRSIDDRVRNLEIGAGEMKGRVANLPSTWALIGTVIGGQIALAGLLLGAVRFGGGH